MSTQGDTIWQRQRRWRRHAQWQRRAAAGAAARSRGAAEVPHMGTTCSSSATRPAFEHARLDLDLPVAAGGWQTAAFAVPVLPEAVDSECVRARRMWTGRTDSLLRHAAAPVAVCAVCPTKPILSTRLQLNSAGASWFNLLFNQSAMERQARELHPPRPPP